MDNPLDSLEMYRKFKDLRAYYVMRVHRNLHKDYKHSVGVLLLQELFALVRHMAVINTSHDRERKREAAEAVLVGLDLVIDQVEFLSTVPDAGVSLHQAAVMYEMLDDIGGKVGAFRKRLSLPESEAQRAQESAVRQ